MKICKICGREALAKNLCHNHYSQLYYYGRIGTPRSRLLPNKKCKIKNCGREHYAKGYCKFHYSRKFYCNIPINYSLHGNKGPKGSQWRGGVAKYPNYSLMRKNRLIVLLYNPRCEICRKPATQIHHRDFSKDNHKLSNLMAICCKCNKKLSSKFYQKYKMTLKEIVSRLGRSYNYWWQHQKELNKVLLDKG